ncbi:DUF1796 family putative cysteine peptidase [Paenibacillus jamilae]|uniref:DUF1796 family putative cysteine peptidase n=1 Tax=Paenibacillus TaxID=44249 RepID=UPI00077CD666|nr:DUF1796 family putative cysteine peptidase [Paenibacillus polymyxa]KYG94792.1 peptidase [Paenibacillus polymyxa]
MRLAQLAGEYEAVFSLGQNCTPAIQLEKNRLRPFAGVLDWMMSDTLSDVNRLLENRFAGFMDLPNLSVVGTSQLNYMVRDIAYNVISVHDFPQERNTSSDLVTYPEFKEKIDRRIERFFAKTQMAKRSLFVRMLGTYEEVEELERILSGMVANEFRLLVVNCSGVTELTEVDWQLPHVCAVEMPFADVWNYKSDPHWRTLFKEMTLSSERGGRRA